MNLINSDALNRNRYPPFEELDPKKNFGEYLAYGTTDKPSFGNYGNIFENMNHPSVKPNCLNNIGYT